MPRKKKSRRLIDVLLYLVKKRTKTIKSQTKKSIECIYLQRGADTYVFIYDDSKLEQLWEAIGELANNEELNFSWCDVGHIRAAAKEILEEKHNLIRSFQPKNRFK